MTSLNLFEHVIRYDNVSKDRVIEIPFHVEKDVAGPVYVLYQLDHFYQNHRRFVTSRDYDQLRGKKLNDRELNKCDPRSGENQQIKDSERIPCGIAANTMFNDIFSVEYLGDATKSIKNNISSNAQEEIRQQIEIKKDGIVWPSDKKLYKSQAGSQKDVTSDAFIGWMKPAALPSFRKMYGIITDGLKKGDYQVNIVNNYNLTLNEKSVVFTKHSWFGGKNDLLGIMYVVFGGLCGILALIVAVKSLFCPKKYPLLDEKDE
eukprot:MONOS_3197.1-p1 / transcript=MONOS_3197.1 / gene=MONOS_3197 / organism=Monocercomonoides_exilis_PA203 / gene_product=LEM3 / transcript_product=LEM3 / location=Mono_scaffold00073:63932-65222(+) / protein_length=260 / sequence_SO=supercontig / SO=protein_coding / is_pseudo=false